MSQYRITLKQIILFLLPMQITYQPFIRKHSYLDNRYHALLASAQRLQILGSMPQAEDRSQNLGHIKPLKFVCFMNQSTERIHLPD